MATIAEIFLDRYRGMIYGDTRRVSMNKSKTAISLNKEILERLDRLVKTRIFPNRSRAIEKAIEEKLRRLEKSRLARECSKLDPTFEKAMAEEGISGDSSEWPEY